ncbi:DNA-binding response regulator, NarL/FixJ family, contains REC and HTH domains [Nocardioides alpinus]|uniref:DNA-binding response regulator n=1 Tax=Nocardioides alpinus TaxID=748909 RepID=A0A1I0V812_9ACTN|nr:DNA-binding response regulator [Nocardioides alpinus]SFA72392.1 DNA-binding response regulator, NarL/FixJ family, contains REC and HTH domains [Nocardioides alpinus]
MDGVIRVLVVDDDPLVRSALSLMLGGQGDIEVVGEADNGASGLSLVTELDPHVVLMDIRMPVMDGLEATHALHQRPTPPAVVVLTTFDADDHVLRAIAAGADGFLLKDTPPGDIVQAIRTVAAGDAMLSPSATRSLVSRLRSATPTDRSTTAAERLTALTERELEVAVCVGRGLSNSEIASELYLSIPTVKSHVSRLLTKLHCTNRVQVAMVVHDAGLV